MNRTSRHVVVLLVTLAAASLAWGEWSKNPDTNLSLADRTGPQVQPKISPTPDSGYYVSWYDDSSAGYDVYLQRLDAMGNEQWPHDGVLIADRSYSSTQDYGLSYDTAGNAWIAFNDDRSGEAITVNRVSRDGVLLWGTSGVQAASGGGWYGPPMVAGTTDGNVVVAWTDELGNVVAQKLDPSGAPLWGGGITYVPSAGSFFVSDLIAAEDGTAILSFTHPTGSWGSPIHLWAQKLAAADGASLWAAGHVQVFDGGSLQFGNFPPMVSDGAGGAVFAWYTNSPSLQCRAQRVLANGTEAFVHNGVEVSTVASRIRVSPSAAFLPATSEVFVFWTEEDSLQSQWGLYGQKLDATGARQWTDAGAMLLPLGANQLSIVTTLPAGSGAAVSWIEYIAYGHQLIHAARVTTDGTFAWNPTIVDLATSVTDKGRLDGGLGPAGFAAYVFEVGDYSNADVRAQNLNLDGTLGPGLFFDGFETGDTTRWADALP